MVHGSLFLLSFSLKSHIFAVFFSHHKYMFFIKKHHAISFPSSRCYLVWLVESPRFVINTITRLFFILTVSMQNSRFNVSRFLGWLCLGFFLLRGSVRVRCCVLFLFLMQLKGVVFL